MDSEGKRRRLAERAAHFNEGKRRWRAQLTLPACDYGVTPQWHPEGESYQSQLYCPKWREWINPSGFTCELCNAHKWPNIVRARDAAQAALDSGDKERAEKTVLGAVSHGDLTQQQAEEIARDFGWIQ